nr:uncharacterized protein LOC112013958 [Quercus suber]POE48493.1 isoform 2 of putative oxidoreductase glyr1 [Quercus suber]
MKMGSNKKARVLEGGVFGSGRVGNFGVDNLGNGNSGSWGTSVCYEVDDSKEIDSVLEAASMVYGMGSSSLNLVKRVSRETKMGEIVSDDFEENVKYEVGDMVWGKVKSYPWWPGQIFDEAFAVLSVRRTKKKGHVLVAFFGDSSYGWLNVKELIPFDPHYAEKSMQTNAKAFVSAVEDAENEACRRAALGLECRCRGPSNFRPVDARGFYAVDVGGYEPHGVYSMEQIRRARDEFFPLEMLSFVWQMALMPCSKLQGNVDWIKSMAKVLAYRMAVFEESDETYSHASGIDQVCPASSKRVLNQQELLSQATLSGSSHIDEAFGKKSTSPIKIQCKRDQYFLKQVDDPNILRADHLGQEQLSFLSPSMYEEVALSDGEHVLEGKYPHFFMNTEFAGKEDGIDTFSKVSMPLNLGLAGKESVTVDKEAGLESNRTKLTDSSQDFQQAQPRMLKTDENHNGPENMHLAGRITSPLDTSQPGNVLSTNSHNMYKNPKALKRSEEDLSYEEAYVVDINKKKKTKSNLDAGIEPLYKLLEPATFKALARQSTQDTSPTALVHREDSPMDQQEKAIEACHTISSGSMARQKIFDTRNVETGLSLLISDLLALALNPFHDVEQNRPAIVLNFFLQFRSIVYQGNLVVSSSEEPVLIETQPIKPHVFPLATESNPVRSAQDLPLSSKPPKKRLKSDFYAKSGHIFDCGEDMSTKRLKHLNELKTLTVEKKASNSKPVKSQRRDCKEIGETVSKKKERNVLKKPITPKMVPVPTMLVMNFPRQSALPSVAELKAKFARFGPLDHSASQVSWKASKCHIVFKYNSDAQAAYRYAVQSSSLFGNVKVYYQLQTLGSLEPELHKLGKQLEEEAQYKFPHLTSLCSYNSVESEFQPKSSLQKPPGDDLRSITGIPGTTLNVKLMLGGNLSSESEQFAIDSDIKNSYGNNPTGSSSSSFSTINVNVRNFHKAIPSPLPPPIDLPNPISQFFEDSELLQSVQACNFQHCQVGSRNNHTYYSTPSQSVDISHQMLNLLTKCSEIVHELKCSLGYAPLCL